MLWLIIEAVEEPVLGGINAQLEATVIESEEEPYADLVLPVTLEYLQSLSAFAKDRISIRFPAHVGGKQFDEWIVTNRHWLDPVQQALGRNRIMTRGEYAEWQDKLKGDKTDEGNSNLPGRSSISD